MWQKVRDFYNGFKEGLKAFGKVENKTAFIGHTVFIWILYFTMNFILY